MDRSLIERLHLELRDGVVDDSSSISGIVVIENTVLRNHLSDETTLSDDLKLDGSGVDVRSVETTGAEEADCHTSAGTNECREGLAVCGDEVTAFACGLLARVAEVEDELLVIWEEGEAVDGCVCKEELCCEREPGVGGGGCCCGGCASGCVRRAPGEGR